LLHVIKHSDLTPHDRQDNTRVVRLFAGMSEWYSYTGITTDIDARFNKHLAGKGAKLTKMNPPSHIMASKHCGNRSAASKLEYQIKQLTPAKKRALSLSWHDTSKDKR